MENNCWFLINQDQKEREFEELESKASKIFQEFLSKKEYGKKVKMYRFDIYIKEEVNYGLHNDRVYDGWAHLTCHVDYEKFIESDDEQKLYLLLNASFRLIEFLNEKVVVPKDFNSVELLSDYDEFLKSNNYKLSNTDLDKYVIKVFDLFKFSFHITTTIEVKEDKIHYDLIKLKDFINNSLVGKSFGNSIKQFDFGYELFDFNGQFAEFKKETHGLKRYGTKYKNILVVKQFDYSVMEKLTAKEQFHVLKSSILEAIKDVETMKRKPKDFMITDFYNEISTIIESYEEITGHNNG
ncbi:hypothetical protein E9993_17865 [Labilibacter sediminis]|nr:hypothetical protein E9993_17865 [Labilibacter sediminis]